MGKRLWCLAILSSVCIAAPRDAFALTQFDQQFEELDRNFSKISDQLDYEYVRDCKRIVREMLEAITTDADAEEFAAKVSSVVSNGNAFRFFEYQLLWLGSRVIHAHPPREMAFWDALVRKTTSCNKLTTNAETNNEFASMSISLLAEHFPYEGKLPIQNGAVDWARWKDFETWYSANRDRFRYSVEEKRFVLSTESK
jgi:hypothetical protein